MRPNKLVEYKYVAEVLAESQRLGISKLGMVGNEPSLFRTPCGVFCPQTPMASDAGLDALTAPRDVAQIKRLLADAGYKGEKIVLLGPTNIASAKALADISNDLFKRIGLNELGFKWVESGPLVRSSYHAAAQVRALSQLNYVRKIEGGIEE